MKRDVMLTVASLLSILLMSIHVSEDIVLGYSGGGLSNVFGILILVFLLCGPLLWARRRLGVVIMLLGGVLSAAMPVLHMSGKGVGVARSSGAFFFIWTLYALGVIGTFSVILSVLRLRSAETQ